MTFIDGGFALYLEGLDVPESNIPLYLRCRVVPEGDMPLYMVGGDSTGSLIETGTIPLFMEVSTSATIPLFMGPGSDDIARTMTLFLKSIGSTEVSPSDIPLYMQVDDVGFVQGNVPLFLDVDPTITGSIPLVIQSNYHDNNSIPLYIRGVGYTDPSRASMSNDGYFPCQNSLDLFIMSNHIECDIPLYLQGSDGESSGNIPLYLFGVEDIMSADIPLYTYGSDTLDATIPLNIRGRS